MSNYPIWDCHVHLFPEEYYKNWEKFAALDSYFALLTKKAKSPHATEQGWATVAESISIADEAGVAGLVLQGWYWNDSGLIEEHNDFMADAARSNHERIKAFACVNPAMGAKAITEMERCAKLGFSGFGELGAGANNYTFEDSCFLDVLECAQSLGLPVCIHCSDPVGHDYNGRDKTPLPPLVAAAAKFPDLKIILAHLGGGIVFYMLNPRIAASCQNLYFDTAANPLLYQIKSIQAACVAAGVDKILFGSDFPLLLYPKLTREIDMTAFVCNVIHNTALAEDELEKIMSANILNLLGKG
ncbi:MAG: amidohydrolase family protein [Eubacteriaceae bacterium]|nr:amidohydrolase family protein [Eubacteriaceae bacterium]